MKALVIADDFTGANDTGVQLAKKGARTEVLMTNDQKISALTEVLVINTESRSLPAAAAVERVTAALAPWRDRLRGVLRYKKIDSTLRGNPGAEIDALMRLTCCDIALVAPAIPQTGRITLGGRCYVNHVPVVDTEFASDPKTPIVSSHIGTLIALQSQIQVYELGLNEVRCASLARRLAAFQYRGQRAIVVLDAVTDADLSCIAKAALTMHPLPLLVGAAGLANALPIESFSAAAQRLPVLAIAGSMSEATWQQIERVRDDLWVAIVDIEAQTLLSRPDWAIAQWAQRACALLNAGKHCVLRTCPHPDARNNLEALCRRFELSRAQLGDRLSQLMGRLALEIIDSSSIGGLFLTGGDIAAAVASALQATGYRIRGEVAPCIPYGRLINSVIDDLPVITKAGGFGNADALRDSLAFIEEMYRES